MTADIGSTASGGDPGLAGGAEPRDRGRSSPASLVALQGLVTCSLSLSLSLAPPLHPQGDDYPGLAGGVEPRDGGRNSPASRVVPAYPEVDTLGVPYMGTSLRRNSLPP